MLSPITKQYQIFDAWSDEPWINEGAAVRVSLVSFGNCSGRSFLNGTNVARINSDLSASNVGVLNIDLTTAVVLTESQKAAFSGFKMNGSFDVPEKIAQDWLAMPNPHGEANSEVLHAYANARDITTRSRNQWVIYFRNLSEVDASLYEKPFEWVLRHVKTERQTKREENLRQKWWIHERPRPELRLAISGLPRILATPMVSKFRLFVWLPTIRIPENAAIVIARSDDTTFGILHSRFHELWSLQMCTWMGKGNDPRYTPTTCFETFPFPAGLTPQDTASQKTETLPDGSVIPEFPTNQANQAMVGLVSGATSKRPKAVERPLPTPSALGQATANNQRATAERIAKAAKHLNDLRENWLNPPEWTDRIPEVTPLGMTSSPYPDRTLAKPGHEKDLAERTLTKLYNQRPAWLDSAQKALDAAVAAAYGWADYTAAMPDEEILKRLLALNLERAANQ